EDSQFAVNYVYDNAKRRAEQELAIQALRDKCDILWAQLDALYFAYVQPGWPPPGTFQSEGGERAPPGRSQPAASSRRLPLGRNRRRARHPVSRRCNQVAR